MKIKFIANRRSARREAAGAAWDAAFNHIWDEYDQVFRDCGGESWLRHNLSLLNPCMDDN